MESSVRGLVFTPGGGRLILALILAVAIGFSLALLGSGGSIITLPVLVYAAGVPAAEAVGMSLAVVGGTSLVASVTNARNGLVHGKAAVLFSITGIVGALLVAQLTHLVSASILMLLFSILMVVVAILMLRRRSDLHPVPSTHCRWPICAGTGLLVGVLTGFLGVGGGFLIVPAMVLFGHLPLKSGIATSLVVITANSIAGLAGHLRQTPFDWSVASMFLGVAVAGMLAGRLIAGRIAVAHLRRAFAWFVLAVAVFVVAKNWAVLT